MARIRTAEIAESAEARVRVFCVFCVFCGFLIAFALLAGRAVAASTLGQPAPDFHVADQGGRLRSLAEFKGKLVVLEWTSDACPYSHKHYDSGNMQHLQARAKKQGVVWLTVMTAGPGMAAYKTPAELRAWIRKVRSHATAVLRDEGGDLARAYEARTTPHMFIVDKAGRLVYMGGIDDRPYYDPASLKGAVNYVALALQDLKAGRPVARPVTQPYGCSVEYPSPATPKS